MKEQRLWILVATVSIICLSIVYSWHKLSLLFVMTDWKGAIESMAPWTVITVLIGVLGYLYFLPSIIASKTEHESGVFILNLFLGWTLIGWVIALVWAVSDKPVVPLQETQKCPFCAETIKKEAKVCRFCSRDLPVNKR